MKIDKKKEFEQIIQIPFKNMLNYSQNVSFANSLNLIILTFFLRCRLLSTHNCLNL